MPARNVMKCVKCGGVAVINMPQHRLRLCEEHFVEWVVRMVERTIQRYRMFGREDRILVAVSGGKDSLGLWDILLRLGYQAEGLYIHLGIPHQGYSDLSQAKVEAFVAERGDPPLHVVNVAKQYGYSVPELARSGARGNRVCSVCGLVKRHIMNEMAWKGGYAAIATGHNLDDEAATLLQNNLHWSTGYLLRQAPVLPSIAPGLARKVKPLCHLYERESAAYTLVRGIDYIEDECPYSVRAKSIFYKGILNDLERRSPGTKLRYYRGYLQAREEGLFNLQSESVEMRPCRQCGQPTTAGDLCAFCRLLARQEEGA